MAKKIEEEKLRKRRKQTPIKAVTRSTSYDGCGDVSEEQLVDYETNYEQVTLYHDSSVGSITKLVSWQVIKNYFSFWEVTSNETVTLSQDENHTWNITNITHSGSYVSSTCRLIPISWEEAGYSLYPDYNYSDGQGHKTKTALVNVFGNVTVAGYNLPANNYATITAQ